MPKESSSTSTTKQAERALIGKVLSDPDVLHEVVELVPSSAVFSVSTHRKAWDQIVEFYNNGDSIDAVTVADATGIDAATLADMQTKDAFLMSAQSSAKLVQDKWMQRRTLEIADIIQRGQEENLAAPDILDKVQQQVYEIDEMLVYGNYTPLGTAGAEALARIESIVGSEDGLLGVPSGYSDLDALTAGWQDTDLTIVAGRPSMGKTAFALELAHHAASAGFPVGIFSLEMGETQLGQRLLTMIAKIDAHKARTGKVDTADLEGLRFAQKRMDKLRVYIDDTSGITPMRLRSISRKMILEHDVKLLIVDYLQLMTAGGKYSSREQEVAFVSRSLKGIAKDWNIPVVALAQLNRGVEYRKEKVPTLADLRESGQIEQDADNVLFIHRPEYYGIEVDENGRSTAGIAEVHIAKQRNGPLGTVRLAFHKQYAGFHSLTEYYDQEPQQLTESDQSDRPDDEIPF